MFRRRPPESPTGTPTDPASWLHRADGVMVSTDGCQLVASPHSVRQHAHGRARWWHVFGPDWVAPDGLRSADLGSDQFAQHRVGRITEGRNAPPGHTYVWQLRLAYGTPHAADHGTAATLGDALHDLQVQWLTDWLHHVNDHGVELDRSWFGMD